MVYHRRSGQITELKIILLPRLWRIVTVVASSHGKTVIISKLSGCSVICLLVVLVFFLLRGHVFGGEYEKLLLIFIRLFCITYSSQKSIDTWNSSKKDGIIIQFQLNVIVLQINSGCAACSTIAQCNMIISTVLTGKDQCQTAFRKTIAAYSKFTMSTKQKYYKSWYSKLTHCKILTFLLSTSIFRCSCESERFFAFIRYKLKWISNTWHPVYLIFELISLISSTYCAIKNAS